MEVFADDPGQVFSDDPTQTPGNGADFSQAAYMALNMRSRVTVTRILKS